MNIESNTKARIMRAAEVIFAVQGINGAQLREINRAAGQSNNSALHYHFGSREGLLRAVLRDHADGVGRQRHEIIQRWKDQEPSLRQVLEALAKPLADKLETTRGRFFLRVLLQVREKSGIRDLPTVGGETSAEVQFLYEKLSGHLEWIRVDIRANRLSNWVDMMLGSLATRAEALGENNVTHLSHEDYVVNLVDMGVGALEATSAVNGSLRAPR